MYPKKIIMSLAHKENIMCDNFDSKIVDLLRSVMYSSADENSTLFAEVELLGKLIAQRDKVPYDAEHNRLIQALKFIQQLEHTWNSLEHLNDLTE